MATDVEVEDAWQSLGVKTCHVCLFRTSDMTVLQTHVCRRIAITFNKRLDVFVCSICQIEQEEYDFIEHLQYHIVDKPFKCSFCDQDFATKKRVFGHLIRCHPQKHQSYELKVQDSTGKYLQTARTKGRAFIIPVKKFLGPEALEPTSDIINGHPSLFQTSNVPSGNVVSPVKSNTHHPEGEMAQTDAVENIPQVSDKHCEKDSTSVPEHPSNSEKGGLPLIQNAKLAEPVSNQFSEVPSNCSKRMPVYANQSNCIVKYDPDTDLKLPLEETLCEHNYSYLNIFTIQSEILYVCSKCQCRFKDKDSFLLHIWKKHAHPLNNFSCCSSTFNIKCPHLQRVVKILHERSMGLFEIHFGEGFDKDEKSMPCEEDKEVLLPLISQPSSSTVTDSLCANVNQFRYREILSHDPDCLLQLKKEVKQEDYNDETDTNTSPTEVSDNSVSVEQGSSKNPDNLNTRACLSVVAFSGGAATVNHTMKSNDLSIQNEANGKEIHDKNQATAMLTGNVAVSNDNHSSKISDTLVVENEAGVVEQISKGSNESIVLEGHTSFDCDNAFQNLSKKVSYNLFIDKNANVKEANKSSSGDDESTEEAGDSSRRVLVNSVDQMSESNVSEIEAIMNEINQGHPVSCSDMLKVSDQKCEGLSIDNPDTSSFQNCTEQKNDISNIPEQKNDISNISEQMNDISNIPEQKNDISNVPEQKNDISNVPLVRKDNRDDDGGCNFYKCSFSQCHFSSSSPVDFLTHNQEHHGMECSFLCFYCGFEGPCTGSLLDHMDLHLGQSSDHYSGSILENSLVCEKVEHRHLNTMLSLIESKSKSMSRIEYACNNCESHFLSLEALKSHLESSTLRTYSCNYCRSNFLNSKSVERHNKEKHPAQPRFRRQESKLLCRDRALHKESFSKLLAQRIITQDACIDLKHAKSEKLVSSCPEVNSSKFSVRDLSTLNLQREQHGNKTTQAEDPKPPLVNCHATFDVNHSDIASAFTGTIEVDGTSAQVVSKFSSSVKNSSTLNLQFEQLKSGETDCLKSSSGDSESSHDTNLSDNSTASKATKEGTSAPEVPSVSKADTSENSVKISDTLNLQLDHLEKMETDGSESTVANCYSALDTNCSDSSTALTATKEDASAPEVPIVSKADTSENSVKISNSLNVQLDHLDKNTMETDGSESTVANCYSALDTNCSDSSTALTATKEDTSAPEVPIVSKADNIEYSVKISNSLNVQLDHLEQDTMETDDSESTVANCFSALDTNCSDSSTALMATKEGTSAPEVPSVSKADNSEYSVKISNSLNLQLDHLEKNTMETDGSTLAPCNSAHDTNYSDSTMALTATKEGTSTREKSSLYEANNNECCVKSFSTLHLQLEQKENNTIQTGSLKTASTSISDKDKLSGIPGKSEAETNKERGKYENAHKSFPSIWNSSEEKVTVVNEAVNKSRLTEPVSNQFSEVSSNCSKRMPRIYDLCARKSTAEYLSSLYTGLEAGSYICNNCSKEMSRLRNMLCHIFFCQGKISVVNCPYDCSFEGEHPKIVTEHIQEEHPTKDTSCKSFRCINGKKFFKFLKNKKVTQLVFKMACKPSANDHMTKMKTFETKTKKIGPHTSDGNSVVSHSKELVKKFIRHENKEINNETTKPQRFPKPFKEHVSSVETSMHCSAIELSKHINVERQAPNEMLSKCVQDVVEVAKQKYITEAMPLTNCKDSMPPSGKHIHKNEKINLSENGSNEIKSSSPIDAQSQEEMSDLSSNEFAQSKLPASKQVKLNDRSGDMEIQISENRKSSTLLKGELEENINNSSIGRRPASLESCEPHEESFESGTMDSETIPSGDYHCKLVQKDNDRQFTNGECCPLVLCKPEAQLNKLSPDDPTARPTTTTLNNVIPFVNKNLMYKCKLCHLVLTFNIVQMRKHINEKHDHFFTCGYCEEPYFNLTFHKNHVKAVHNNGTPKIQPIPLDLVFSRINPSGKAAQEKKITLQEKGSRKTPSDIVNVPPHDLMNHLKKDRVEEVISRPKTNNELLEMSHVKIGHTVSVSDGKTIECNVQPVEMKEVTPVLKVNDLNRQDLDANNAASHHSKGAIQCDTKEHKVQSSMTARCPDFPNGFDREVFTEDISKENGGQEPGKPFIKSSSKKMLLDGQAEGKHLSCNQSNHSSQDLQPHGCKMVPSKRKMVHEILCEDILGNQHDIKRLCSDRLVHTDTCEMEKRSETDFVWINQSDCPQQNRTNSSEAIIRSNNPPFCETECRKDKENGIASKIIPLNKLFKCKICMVSFSSISEIGVHFLNDHPNAFAQWSDRRVGIQYYADGKFYDKKDVRPSVTRYLCGYCIFETKLKESMTKHMSLAHYTCVDYHYVVPFSPNHEPVAYTEKCLDRDEKRPTQMCCHEIIMTEKPGTKLRYRCHICDMRLNSEFYFRLHLAKHRGFKHFSTLSTTRGLLLCATCGYVASSSNDFAGHVSRHMKERRYCCSSCDFDDHHRKGVELHISRFHSMSSSACVIDNKMLNRNVDIRPKLVDLDPTVDLPKLDLESFDDL